MKTRGRTKPKPQDHQEQEQEHPTGPTNHVHHYDDLQSDISIHLDTNHILMAGRDRSSTLGSFRDRGLTLGSEFDDLDLTLGLDPHMTSAATMTAVHPMDNDPHHHHTTTTTTTSGSHTTNSNKRTRSSSSQNTSSMDYLGILGQAASALAQHDTGTSSTLSTSMPSHPRSSSLLVSRLSGFGPGSGSKSTTLQDSNNNTKGGGFHEKKDELQHALDAYERGDTTALEGMMKSGSLNTKNRNDLDLLVDMDFDFMGMGNAHDPRKRVNSIPGVIQALRSLSNPGSGTSTPNIRGGPSPAPSHTGTGGYDGVGDLDYHSDYGHHHNSNSRSRADSLAELQRVLRADSIADGLSNNTRKVRSDSLAEFQRILRSDSMDVDRLRANSLAFGGLLDDPPHDAIGSWADRTPEEGSRPLKKRMGSFSYPGPERADETTIKRLTKAEIKKREREQKKALREAAKLEKKREKEAKSKIKATARQEKKNMKKNETIISKKKKKKAVKVEYISEDEDEDDRDYHRMDDMNEDHEHVVVSGSGRPRSLSDPNIKITFDTNGLMNLISPPDWVGAYSPRSRKIRVERFVEKRNHRVWIKKVKYDVRKNFADSRLRVKGRFVKKEDESLMRDLMSLT